MRRAALALLLASPAAAASWRVEEVERRELPDRVETLLRFPSPVKSPWPANDVVWGHLSVPRSAVGRRASAVLVLPVMAAPNVWIEERFIERFLRDGLVVLRLDMPTQFRRRPHPSMPSGQVFLARSAPRLAANFRQSVADARRALDVLAARPEADAARLAVFGISLGALVGSSVHAADPRTRYGVFVMGGAGFAEIVVEGSLTGPFARRMGLGKEALEKAFAGLDPGAYKGGRAKEALLVNAWSDTVIPRSAGRRLRDAFPAARQVWVPFGHYTGIVHLLWLPRWVSGRLRDALSEKSR